MSNVEVVLTPGEVARRLGVSPSGLRRLATVYAELYGELPKDPSATARIWTPEAVRRLEGARALMAAGRARSIKDGLQALEAGVEPSIAEATALSQDGRILEALGVLTARLESVLNSNARLENEVSRLREEIQSKPPALPSAMPYSRPATFGAGTALDDEPETSSKARAGSGTIQDGVIVRIAKRLERILRR